jgi:hypothetical protein
MAEVMSLKETDESTAGAAAECSQECMGSEQQSCSSGDRSDTDTMKQPCAFFMRTGTCAYVSSLGDVWECEGVWEFCSEAQLLRSFSFKS